MMSTETISSLELSRLRRLASKVVNLNPKCSEIGAGMLAELIDTAASAIGAREAFEMEKTTCEQ